MSDRPKARFGRAGFLVLALLLGLALGGCEGETASPTASGGVGGSGTGPIAGGGVGGTGTGTVTSVNVGSAPMTTPMATTAPVGSIELNGGRSFTINADTRFFIEGVAVSATTFLTEGKGLVVRIDLAKDVSADFTSGTALRVEGRYLLRGPVTGLSPLRVMGQEVRTVQDTVLGAGLATTAQSGNAPTVGAAGADWEAQLAARMQAGPVLVEVSGHLGSAGVVEATRLALAGTRLPEWKLTGTVVDTTPLGFMVGEQSILMTALPTDCGAGPVAGDAVSVRFAPSAAYLADLAADLLRPLEAASIQCVRTDVEVPVGVTETLLTVGLEGLVSDLTLGDGYSFIVGGQKVLATDATVYRGGKLADLTIGSRVDVVGQLDVTTGILTASEVTIFAGQVVVEGPLSASSLFSITTLGITAQRTSQTTGDVGLFGAWPAGQQVRIEGRRGLFGNLYANRVTQTGTAGSTPTQVRASVEYVWPWRNGQFTVLGVPVDVTGAELQGADGTVLTKAQFMALLAPGVPVHIEGARYDVLRRTLSDASRISISQ